MKILIIGDIVGGPGRDAVAKVLPDILRSDTIDFVIANAENIAHGRGVTESTLKQMQDAGVDYFTSGDHLFWQKGSLDIIESLPVIRPANYPKAVPGEGYKIFDLGKKGKILLINLMGRTFLNERLDDPFSVADMILEKYKDEKSLLTLVDFHAEATSEKYALGFYLDGRVTSVTGTHTHVPTCDNRALPKGTLFVADVGMSGNVDSVLGVKKEIIIDMYTTALNQKFEWEESGRKAFNSVLIDTEEISIKRIDKYL